MSAGPENRPIGGDAAPEELVLDLMRPLFDPHPTFPFQGEELVSANRRPTPFPWKCSDRGQDGQVFGDIVDGLSDAVGGADVDCGDEGVSEEGMEEAVLGRGAGWGSFRRSIATAGRPMPRADRQSILMGDRRTRFATSLIGAALAVVAAGATAAAAPIANDIAVFSGLDKITAEIEPVEIGVGAAVRFGSLEIRPRVCYTRPPTEPPQTTTFVEIDEHELSGEVRRVFTGWMFASSPGLNALEHPVYDVWLKTCKTSSGGKSDAILEKSP
jgi:hypothetical protein